MRLFLLAALALASLLLGACAGVPAPSAPAAATPAAPSPAAQGSGSVLIFVNQVTDVSAAGRTVTLFKPINGVDAISLAADTEVVADDGSPRAFTDLKSGQMIEVVGQSDPSGAITPKRIRILAIATSVAAAPPVVPTRSVGGPPVIPTVDPGAQATQVHALPELTAAENVLSAFFGALARKEVGIARVQLTSDAQARLTAETLARDVQPLKTLTVVAFRPATIAPGRLIYEVSLLASVDTATPSDWREGANTRWVELTRTTQGWRINQIATSPIR